jgi:hypothetical protein
MDADTSPPPWPAPAGELLAPTLCRPGIGDGRLPLSAVFRAASRLVARRARPSSYARSCAARSRGASTTAPACTTALSSVFLRAAVRYGLRGPTFSATFTRSPSFRYVVPVDGSVQGSPRVCLHFLYSRRRVKERAIRPSCVEGTYAVGDQIICSAQAVCRSIGVNAT